MTLCISIPAYWDDNTDTLHVKSLKIAIPLKKKDDAQKTLLKHLQNDLKLDIYDLEVVWDQNWSKRAYSSNFESLEVISKDWDRMINFALECEPLVDSSTRKPKKNNPLVDINAEDLLKYGYDYDWLEKK